MHDGIAVGFHESFLFLSAESFFVKFNGSGTVRYDEVRGDCVESIWNWLGHNFFPVFWLSVIQLMTQLKSNLTATAHCGDWGITHRGKKIRRKEFYGSS